MSLGRRELVKIILLRSLAKAIQRVSQFKLSLFFAAQELDFFQEKHIAGSAVLVLEFIVIGGS